MTNTGEFNPSRSRTHVVSQKDYFDRYPIVCTQCYEPPCAKVCPTGAITRDTKTGIVRVSKELCNGCRMCEQACPFGTILFSELEEKAIKCELCDGDPECVRFCSAGALEFREPEAAGAEKRQTLLEKLKEVYYQSREI
jgi:carbon-monoxide dehydrogenase iron sulfur subunit